MESCCTKSYQGIEQAAEGRMEDQGGERGVFIEEASAPATTEQLIALIDQQGYKCSACRLSLEPGDAELDHRTPLQNGGHDGISNLQWLCRDCNRAKGTMTMASFVALCVRVSRATAAKSST